MKQRVVIAGGSGFVGRHLSKRLVGGGYDVVVLSRSSRSTGTIRTVAWDGQTLGPWAAELDDACAVVNLAGKNINCRHTKKNRREILQSRVDSVRALGAAIECAQRPPTVFVQGSAVGIYGDAGERLCAEDAPHGTDFMSQVCECWEAAFNRLPLPKTRRVLLRLGVVLHPDGGLLKMMARLTRLFLGGQIADGAQYVSWIHMSDLCHMFLAALEHAEITGTHNGCAPKPVTNGELMTRLRETLHRPWSPAVPRFAVKIGAALIGTDPSLALVSQRAFRGTFSHRIFRSNSRTRARHCRICSAPKRASTPLGSALVSSAGCGVPAGHRYRRSRRNNLWIQSSRQRDVFASTRDECATQNGLATLMILFQMTVCLSPC